MNYSSNSETLIKVNGADAQSFLQGQFSNDIDKIEQGQWQLNCYCQRQGRIIALLQVGKFDEDFYLLFPVDLQVVVLKHLEKFVLNADVAFHQNAELPSAADIDALHLSMENYPQIFLVSSEMFIPHDLNLDVNEVGVNFSKGCYPGQEVVARVEHLGKPVRRLYRFECDFDPVSMDKLTLDDPTKVVGSVIKCVKSKSQFFATLKITEEKSNIFIKRRAVKFIEAVIFPE